MFFFQIILKGVSGSTGSRFLSLDNLMDTRQQIAVVRSYSVHYLQIRLLRRTGTKASSLITLYTLLLVRCISFLKVTASRLLSILIRMCSDLILTEASRCCVSYTELLLDICCDIADKEGSVIIAHDPPIF